MPKLIDLTGKVYGRLTVISFHGTVKKTTFWNCVCECGKTKIARSGKLRGGELRSCGCLLNHDKRTHGESNKSKEYKSWCKMKERCTKTTNNRYHRYGGRGIKICDRWINSYENFLADMGRAPSSNHSIDRKDNDGNYEPNNCKWSTPKEQANNRSV